MMTFGEMYIEVIIYFTSSQHDDLTPYFELFITSFASKYTIHLNTINQIQNNIDNYN